MYYLTHMFPKTLTVLESVYCFEDLNIQFDLLWSHSIRAYTQKHGNNNLEMIIKNGQMEFTNCVYCFD